MNKMFTQPTGPVAKQVNKQTIARIFRKKQAEVTYLDLNTPIDSAALLYDRETQLTFYRGTATGTPLSWSVASNILTLVTSVGTFSLALADPGDFLKTLLATFVGASHIGVQSASQDLLGNVQAWLVEPTFEAFGAKGDEVTDDTAAIKLAIAYSQDNNVIVRGKPGSTYLITDSLDLVIRPTSTSYKAARVYGSSDVKTKLKFVNTAATEAAIRAVGNTGVSGSNSAYNVHFSGFYCDGTDWGGDGLHWENIALWSLLADVQFWLFKGRGIYAKGYTDHVWRNVEVRGCGGYGIESYEPTVAIDGYYHEVSHMRFVNVNAFASNNYGVQWKIDGGNNLVFVNCKPSEGTVGLDIYRAIGVTLTDTYVDGTTKATDSTQNIGIRINSSSCINYNISGGRFWNVKYPLYILGGGYINVGPWSLSYSGNTTVGNDVADIYVGAAVVLPVTVPAASKVIDNTAGWVQYMFNSRRVSYSATAASGSIGTDGTIVSTYRDNGKWVDIEIVVTIGTSPTLPAYTTFSLPTNRLAATGNMPMRVHLLDTSAGTVFNGSGMITSAGDGIVLYWPTTTAGMLPVTLAAGDKIFITGKYYRKS